MARPVGAGAAYNRAMRAVLPLLLLALAAGPALAQNSDVSGSKATAGHTNPPPPAAKSHRPEQRTQRIHVEDGGSRVDELRIGGQTQSITVQPKVGDVPAYEVQPSDGVRNRPRNGGETNTGTRVWNLKQF